MNQEAQPFDALVIGAGQSGLAAGFHLARSGLRFAILEGGPRVGDVWRHRWDSLRLFTPAQHDGLPGLDFPAPRDSYPSRDDFAGYLEGFAEQFQLPVRTNTRVGRVRKAGELFDVETGSGTLRARNIVAAVGANSVPKVPGFAAELDPGIHQLHTSEYRSPSELPEGDVLVVGYGTSGAEIAAELAAGRRVLIAGRPTPHVPDAVLRHAGEAYWRLIHSAFTVDNPLGRKVAANFHKRGSPLIRISTKDLERAGVERRPRLAGTSAGRPVFDDGTSVAVRTVVWATGYRPSLGWIDGLALGASGWPVTARGAVPEIPGLYFLGMPFQFALTSGLVGGVGRDAAYVVGQLALRVGDQLAGEMAGP